jgi:hypothetical protein
MTWSAKRGVFHPKPNTPEASMSLAGFTVGDKVVCVNMLERLAYHYRWPPYSETSANKVGEIIRIIPDSGLFLISHEDAEYISVKADKLRLATGGDIESDTKFRASHAAELAAELTAEMSESED